MEGFTDFLKKQGVVGLAVGFILGGAISKAVAALVTDIIDPIIGVLLGGAGALAALTLSVGRVEILWGDFVAVVIDFIVIAMVVYFGVKALGVDKLDATED